MAKKKQLSEMSYSEVYKFHNELTLREWVKTLGLKRVLKGFFMMMF